MTLVHTETPPAARGRGLASQLVQGALDNARSRGLKVVPVCWFVRDYLVKHPEYRDLWRRRCENEVVFFRLRASELRTGHPCRDNDRTLLQE